MKKTKSQPSRKNSSPVDHSDKGTSLRERILSHLASPAYRPANEAALMRALDLSKKFRGRLAHEIRLLLSNGKLRLVQGSHLALANANRESRRAEKQKDARPQNPSSGNLIGRIQFRSNGHAFVTPDVKESPPAGSIHIFPEDTGTALHGDRVEISLRNPSFAQRNRDKKPEKNGRVMSVIERGRETVVGTLKRIRTSHYVVADDPRFFHQIAIENPSAAHLSPPPAVGDKVVVKLYAWSNRHRALEGEIIEVLGRSFEPAAELLGLYRKYNLEPAFPEAVLDEVGDLPDRVTPSQLAGRRDCRNIPTFTIDPEDAKDFDDAISIEPLAKGQTRIGIHIADVSTYVRPGSALDKEAQKRGNSTYLVGTVIPMLPEKLSNGLCSLVEAQDRLTKSVFLIFDAQAQLQHTEYATSVIRSDKRLTYKQAYALLFTDDLEKIRALPLPPKHQTGSTGRALASLSTDELAALQTRVRQIWSIASVLRQRRMDNGSLDLDMPETKIFVDEQGYADRLELVQNDESHQLIEELMLAANEAVARLTRTHRLPSLYRVHDEPDAERLNELREELATHGIETSDLNHRPEMTQLLRTLETHPQGYLLRTQVLRSLKKACYRASPDGHYGLNKKDYAHFTSPIRRYADLVVHRVLEYYLQQNEARPRSDGPRFKPTLAGMDSLAEHLSLTEVNSQEAERESVKIKQLEFFEREMQKPAPASFEAVVTDVRAQGVFVELPQSMTFGFIATSSMDGDFFLLNNAGDAFVGHTTKRVIGIGKHILVKVAKVDRVKRMIDFRLCTEAPPNEDPAPPPTPKPKVPGQRSRLKKSAKSRPSKRKRT